MYQPRCPSVYLWSSSTYFQKVSAIYPQILFLFCNFLFPPSKDKHLTCSCPMSLLSLIISLIIVYSLFHIWKLEVQNVKLNLLLKNCFENNPNWWDIIDLNTSLTFQDVDESLNIADHTHHIMLPLSNLCCVCLNDICLECSNKAFIDGWDDSEIQLENIRSDGRVFWKYIIFCIDDIAEIKVCIMFWPAVFIRVFWDGCCDISY